MGRQLVLDSSDHSTFKFHRNNRESLLLAEQRFRRLVAEGFIPAEKRAGGQLVALTPQDRRFDPGAEETVFIPALRGG